MEDSVKKKEGEGAEESAGNDGIKIWDCGSPLYDSFEVASVGHLIDRHALALLSPGGTTRFPASVSSVSRDGTAAGHRKFGGAVSRFLGMKLTWKKSRPRFYAAVLALFSVRSRAVSKTQF